MAATMLLAIAFWLTVIATFAIAAAYDAWRGDDCILRILHWGDTIYVYQHRGDPDSPMCPRYARWRNAQVSERRAHELRQELGIDIVDASWSRQIVTK